jgi:hypothetical protein
MALAREDTSPVGVRTELAGAAFWSNTRQPALIFYALIAIPSTAP